MSILEKEECLLLVTAAVFSACSRQDIDLYLNSLR